MPTSLSWRQRGRLSTRPGGGMLLKTGGGKFLKNSAATGGMIQKNDSRLRAHGVAVPCSSIPRSPPPRALALAIYTRRLLKDWGAGAGDDAKRGSPDHDQRCSC